MKVIGLTGPAAAGKNEVARILRRRGAQVIDADKVAHELYATQSPVWHELIKAFGSRILVRGGKIDRKKLGELVFADQKKLRLLNKLVHPALKTKIVEIIESCKSSVVSCKLVVINAAVLKEIGLLDLVDEVWVVLASRETRLKRLVKKGLTGKEARQRVGTQLPQKEYLRIADRVIRNEGTLKQLYAGI